VSERVKKPSPSPSPLSQPSPAMVPLYLSLAALSYLSFAGAAHSRAPLHIPLVVERKLSVDEYWIAADTLRFKYGVPHSSLSKRHTTSTRHNTGIAAIPITDRVCPCSTL